MKAKFEMEISGIENWALLQEEINDPEYWCNLMDDIKDSLHDEFGRKFINIELKGI